MPKTNGHVTWMGLFAFATLVSLGIGAGFSYHTQQPHEGAVRLHELAPIIANQSALAAALVAHADQSEASFRELMIAIAKLGVQFKALEDG